MQKYPLAFLCCLSFALGAQCPDLVWSDEFNGDTLDLNNWTYEIGDGCDRNLCGWGNQEAQSYQRENAVVNEGFLTITAKPETVGNSSYTSSRIISRDKQDFTYGRMEARIKVPAGDGTWPAFWMLSTDEEYGGWPRSGEIDIMEYVGREPNQVLGTIHYGQPSPNNRYNTSDIRFQESLADDFHEFAVEWEETEIRWFVDDILYGTQRPEDLNGQNWPFNKDFFFILNLAVGGNLGGAIDPAAFPADMVVDYVRVYGANRPYITGPRSVKNDAADNTYQIGNLSGDVPVTWSVPATATIVSGQGTPEVTVDWAGGEGGTISAATVLSCGNQTLSMNVVVEPAVDLEFSLENFDDEALLTFEFATGVLTEIDNPAPDSLNGSALVGSYARAAGSQYDVLVYQTGDAIANADDFVDGARQLYVDVYTTAPVGTELLFQFETAAAAGDNYPTGRHSRYQAPTTVSGSWERIAIPFLDQPDGGAPGTDVTKLVILFAPNSNTGDTYIFDNLDVYSEVNTGLLNRALPTFPLTASPNPVTDLLRLDFSAERSAPAVVEVFSVDGRLMVTQHFDGIVAGPQTLRLSVGQLPTGTYLARVRQADRAASVRFVR